MNPQTKKPVVIFMPTGTQVEIDSGTKILVAARQGGIPIRFMCASLRCGTCGVKVDASSGKLSEPAPDEIAMLQRLKLPVDGSIRMSCRTRIIGGEVSIDLDFQDSYDPSNNLDFDDV